MISIAISIIITSLILCTDSGYIISRVLCTDDGGYFFVSENPEDSASSKSDSDDELWFRAAKDATG